ncbi:MAG: tRNA (adenosine(37)-N6)-threonylcarbamoyltransferase complex ATPase subunit type 1 TsaE [Pseudomonadota bacterium]
MSQSLPIPTLADCAALAQALAARLRVGDVVTLRGEVGAGKTTFAQFLIHALSPVPVEVTSPTFTILQTYPVILSDGAPCELYHYDLYRIEHESALIELGLEDALAATTLIEWPERLGGYRLPIALALSFHLAKDGARSVTATGDDPRWKDLRP